MAQGNDEVVLLFGEGMKKRQKVNGVEFPLVRDAFDAPMRKGYEDLDSALYSDRYT